MRDKRLAIVAALVVVEFALVGAMFRAVGGGRAPGGSWCGMHRFGFGSRAFAAQPASNFAKTLETGPAPHVYISDPRARLIVNAQPGTSVRVNEQTVRSGYVGETSALDVRQDDGGVRIERQSTGHVMIFGSLRRTLSVTVPPGARVEVAAAGSTDISGLRAGATVNSSNGVLAVHDHRGDIALRTRNGRIELHDVDAPTLSAMTYNGRVELDRVRSASVTVQTRNGRVDASAATLRDGTISTRNGNIALAFARDNDITVSATTGNGKIRVDAPLLLDGTSVRIGNGSGRLQVASGNGPISISLEGV